MPGILGAILSIFATLQLSKQDSSQFPHGEGQAGIQTAALGITLGLALLGGLVTGIIVWLLKWVHNLFPEEFFNDRTFWDIPSDYEKVVREEEEEELKDIKKAEASGVHHTLSRGKTQILTRKHPRNMTAEQNGVRVSQSSMLDSNNNNNHNNDDKSDDSESDSQATTENEDGAHTEENGGTGSQ